MTGDLGANVEFLWRNFERGLGIWFKFRGAFHSRIAWLVVFAGIALFAAPWWLQLIAYLIEQFTEYDATKLVEWGNQFSTGAGIALVAMGLSYHLVMHGWTTFLAFRQERDQRERFESNDRRIYEGFRVIMDERWLRDFLYTLDSDHSYMADDSRTILQAQRYLALTECQFLNDRIEKSAKDLAWSLGKLYDFVVLRFFVYPHDQANMDNYRYCMQPNANMDRDGSGTREENQLYGQLTEELNKLQDDLTTAFEKFVRAAKRAF